MGDVRVSDVREELSKGRKEDRGKHESLCVETMDSKSTLQRTNSDSASCTAQYSSTRGNQHDFHRHGKQSGFRSLQFRVFSTQLCTRASLQARQSPPPPLPNFPLSHWERHGRDKTDRRDTQRRQSRQRRERRQIRKIDTRVARGRGGGYALQRRSEQNGTRGVKKREKE